MRVVVMSQPEISADTANIFEASLRDIQSMNCRELNDLLGEADFFTKALTGFRAKEASIIVMRGSNINVDVKEALDFLKNDRELIASQISKKCIRPRPQG